jgi:hypothetical protein
MPTFYWQIINSTICSLVYQLSVSNKDLINSEMKRCNSTYGYLQ